MCGWPEATRSWRTCGSWTTATHERIGRVLTAPAARGAGLAQRLMTEALTVIGNRPSVLDAQAHLVGFYTRFGYAQTGPEYLEDGIPHVPMSQGSAATSSVTERRRPV